jgi:hypothetical protein
VFLLETNDANRKLSVQFDKTLITAVDHPKYLVMTVDRTLSYKPYLEKAGMKVNSQKLSGTKWGSGTHTLRTACRALVYSDAIE